MQPSPLSTSRTFHLPKLKLGSLSVLTPTPCSHPWHPRSTVCLCGSDSPSTSCGRNHSVFVPLCLADVTEGDVLKVCPRGSRCQTGFLSKAVHYSVVSMFCTLLIHTSLEGPSGGFPSPGLVHDAAVNAGVRTPPRDPAFKSFGFMPRLDC